MHKQYELKPAELRSLCDPKTFKFKDTSEVEPLDDVAGRLYDDTLTIFGQRGPPLSVGLAVRPGREPLSLASDDFRPLGNRPLVCSLVDRRHASPAFLGRLSFPGRPLPSDQFQPEGLGQLVDAPGR